MAPNSTATADSGAWFTRNARSIVFLVVVVACVGAYLAFTIPVAVFPSTNFPRVVIGIDNGVMPIDQMLVTVTRPVEQAVNSVQGLESVRSITSRGSAEIDLFFNWNVDMFQTLQRVDSALTRVESTLPPGAKIDTHRLTFASFPILGYSLTSDRIPQTDLWEMATYEIGPRLNRLNGVSTVLVQGGQEPEMHIVPDPAKLLAASVTVNDILDAVQKTNLVDSPGLFERNHQLVLGLVTGQARSPEQLGQIVVKTTPGGVPVRIGDLGAVQRGVKPVYTLVRADGKPAVLLSINRQPDSNTVEVADEVHNEIEQIRKSLPAGVRLESYYDQSEIVRGSIRSVRDAIIIGLILSAGVLVLFLRDWGTSLVAGLVIPITILVTFIVLKALGQTFNLMTLGGLAAAVGLVIDDAIVVVENIVLHRDAGQGRIEAIKSALREITVPLVGSTLTPIVVFLPLFSITGVLGTFFSALAVTMSAALLTSLVLALVWTPILSHYFIRRNEADPAVTTAGPEAGSEMERLLAAEEVSMRGFFGKVIAFYERWLKRALEHPWWLASGSAALILLSVVCFVFMDQDYLPEMDEGGFIVDYWMPPGSSLQETDRVISHVERMLHEMPEVESTSRRTGLELGLAAVTEANRGDVSVKLKARRSRDVDEIVSDLRARIAREEPALEVEFPQLLSDMIGDLTSEPEPVVIKLFSQDTNLLYQTAPRVADAIDKAKGVVDIKNGVENTISGPAMEYRVNPTVAAKAGFTTQEVSTDAEAIVEGIPAATPVVSNGRPYTVRVRFPEQFRASQTAINNTLLVSTTGRTATLGNLTTPTEMPGQTEIRRENLQPLVEVTGRLEGTSLGKGMQGVQAAINNLHLPKSIRVVYGGTYQEQQKSYRELALILFLAVVLVFTVLLFEFRSFSAPVAILSSALLSTSGVFLALLVARSTVNVASLMGVIMVVGIVAKNGILLLDANQKFAGAGYEPEEAMIQAGRRRLRPIVMTAMASVAGMLPLAFAIGAGSQMLQPLAIAVIGGILISMVLSLIVTPAVFFYLGRRRS